MRQRWVLLLGGVLLSSMARAQGTENALGAGFLLFGVLGLGLLTALILLIVFLVRRKIWQRWTVGVFGALFLLGGFLFMQAGVDGLNDFSQPVMILMGFGLLQLLLAAVVGPRK